MLVNRAAIADASAISATALFSNRSLHGGQLRRTGLMHRAEWQPQETGVTDRPYSPPIIARQIFEE